MLQRCDWMGAMLYALRKKPGARFCDHDLAEKLHDALDELAAAHWNGDKERIGNALMQAERALEEYQNADC